MRTILRYGAGFAGVVLCWLVLAAGATLLLTPDDSAVAVFAPLAGGLATVAAADGLALDERGWFLFARSPDPGFVRRLYAAGAILVIDADAIGGCSVQRAERAAANRR